MLNSRTAWEILHPVTSCPYMLLAHGMNQMEVWLIFILIVSSCFSLLFKTIFSNSLALTAYSGCLLIYHVIAQRDPFSELKNRSVEIFCVSCWYSDIFRSSFLFKCLPQHVLQQNSAPETFARAAYLPCFRHSSFLPTPTVILLWPTG